MARKGSIPWNKGLTKETDERVEKYSNNLKNKPRNRVFTEEQRRANGERTSARYANMTVEEKEEVSRIQKAAYEKGRSRMTEERKLEIRLAMEEGLRNLSPERKTEKNKKISEAKKNPDGLSHNPETWKIECSGCKNKITFEKYHQFQNAKSAIKKGKKKFCTDCKNKNCKRSQTNKESWKIECQDEDCQTVIQYDNFPAYARALKRIEEGTPKYCDSCRETKYPKKNGPDKIYSTNPDDWKVKCKWEDCDKIITYNTYGSWSGVCKRIKDDNPPMCLSCASKQADRTQQYLNNSGKPNYNRRTIDYIINILNKKFETNFLHGESETGEYFVFDKELKTYYFADAYCPKLNLWIEFDEKYHFREKKLRDECQIRHMRIKDIIGCNIIRFKFIENKDDFEFIEYHNDLTQQKHFKGE